MLRDGERLDNTGFGGIRVIQRKGLGYGVDAVVLAAFAAGETGASGVASNAKIADLGTGSGIIPFILSHKLDDADITGFEMRENAFDRAVRACELNGLQESVHFVHSDIMNIDMDRYAECFDAVVSNPPYFRKDGAIPNSNGDKYVARHETTATLADFCGQAARLLRPRGCFYMVHRPDRLVDIFCEMRAAGIEPKEIQLIVPRIGEAANIVLVCGVKGGGSELRFLPDLPVHKEGQEYSDIIERIYEHNFDK